jgi:hypothetical protein
MHRDFELGVEESNIFPTYIQFSTMHVRSPHQVQVTSSDSEW